MGDEIICPYCGSHDENSDEKFYDQYSENKGQIEVECYECGKVFHATQHIIYNYTTKKILKKKDGSKALLFQEPPSPRRS